MNARDRPRAKGAHAEFPGKRYRVPRAGSPLYGLPTEPARRAKLDKGLRTKGEI